MTQHALAILLAGSFTFGCAAIHLWREHAADLTAPLAAALLCLTILTSSVGVAKLGAGGDNGPTPTPRALR